MRLPPKKRMEKIWHENWELTLLALLPFAYLVFYCYIPMGGLVLAFKDFNVVDGIFGSKWIGLDNFIQFFSSIYSTRVITNTFLLGFYTLLFSFPLPIIFALCVNELRDGFRKRFVQTASYLPYFMSTVVVIAIMYNIFSLDNGLVNHIIKFFGFEPVPFLNSSKWFRPLYVGSEVWQKFGYNSIIYIAAITGVNPELYEAAEIDGCDRIRKIWNITLPYIKPTMVIMLILGVGGVFSIGFEKVLLMYSPGTYDVADIIQTYVYRKGIIDGDISFASAVGMLQSGVNFVMLVSVNYLSRKINDTALW